MLLLQGGSRNFYWGGGGPIFGSERTVEFCCGKLRESPGESSPAVGNEGISDPFSRTMSKSAKAPDKGNTAKTRGNH